MPVCATNGLTFRNLCEIKCNGARFAHFGRCKELVVKKTDCGQCSDIVKPICGTDGLNYINEC